jgi:hypothetical protein
VIEEQKLKSSKDRSSRDLDRCRQDIMKAQQQQQKAMAFGFNQYGIDL